MSKRPSIYLDHHATTPVDPRVLEAMLPYFRDAFGNASSSTHPFGWRAEAAVNDARERIASALGVESQEIIFTSGATESNNLAIQGVMRAAGEGRCRVVSLVTEHPSVIEACRACKTDGGKLTLVSVAANGLVDSEALAEAIDDETALVSVMAANSEIGVLQPLESIGRLCAERGVLLHSDAAQAVGKIPLPLADGSIDLLSFSGHKIYGPKGIGVLLVRNRRPRIRIRPLFAGGGQERGLRPGTLPVALIVGLARALEIALGEREVEAKRLVALRDFLWQRLCEGLDGLTLNGDALLRLPGNLNVSFAQVDGDRLLLALTDLGISSGSACSSGSGEPSPVLLAIGRSPREAKASLRIGLGRGTTREEVEIAAERVIEEVLAQRGA